MGGESFSLTSRTAAAYRIQQNNTVPEFTKPERIFDSLFGDRVKQPNPIKIEDEGLSLCPDRHFVGTVVLVQIDGAYHDTHRQQKKDEWRDRLLNEKGFRVIHIAAALLMTKKFHGYVIQKTEAFLASDALVEKLAA